MNNSEHIEKHKNIKSVLVPGEIVITFPKIVEDCYGCPCSKLVLGEGYCDDYFLCKKGGGEISGSRHPVGAKFTLDCPFIKKGAKSSYAENVKEAIKTLQEILEFLEK